MKIARMGNSGGQMGKWANGQMDKWTNGQMDKWTNGLVPFCPNLDLVTSQGGGGGKILDSRRNSP